MLRAKEEKLLDACLDVSTGRNIAIEYSDLFLFAGRLIENSYVKESEALLAAAENETTKTLTGIIKDYGIDDISRFKHMLEARLHQARISNALRA